MVVWSPHPFIALLKYIGIRQELGALIVWHEDASAVNLESRGYRHLYMPGRKGKDFPLVIFPGLNRITRFEKMTCFGFDLGGELFWNKKGIRGNRGSRYCTELSQFRAANAAVSSLQAGRRFCLDAIRKLRISTGGAELDHLGDELGAIVAT